MEGNEFPDMDSVAAPPLGKTVFHCDQPLVARQGQPAPLLTLSFSASLEGIFQLSFVNGTPIPFTVLRRPFFMLAGASRMRILGRWKAGIALLPSVNLYLLVRR